MSLLSGPESRLDIRLPDVKSQTRADLRAQLDAWGFPLYRVEQLLSWLYGQGVTHWDQMVNLPRELRARLAAHYALDTLWLVTLQHSVEGTRKFLWRLPDGAMIESVLLAANPALYGAASDRRTLCVSTQVGCAYGCRFCASGLAGWKRNLRPEEIIEQVLSTERWWRAQPAGERSGSSPERAIHNLVIMGMGEPLANYESLMQALAIINAPWGCGIGARKITISTCGLVPQIRRLAEEPQQYRLALSLHGATNEIRDRIMPVNRKYPLEELAPACEYYVAKKGKMISFEYILIAGLNDQAAQVKPLAELARRLHAKVNVIPCNRVPGLPFERPSEKAQEAFYQALLAQHVSATLRREKGEDIDAACGQLRLKTERAEMAALKR